jgi:hypothetical protein
MARSPDITASPTARAMDRAIERTIEGNPSHPERTAFVEADSPHAGHEIVRALDDGYAVALVCADGEERIIVARPPA